MEEFFRVHPQVESPKIEGKKEEREALLRIFGRRMEEMRAKAKYLFSWYKRGGEIKEIKNVLLYTTRYSTYIQHCIEHLGSGIRATDRNAIVFKEAEDWMWHTDKSYIDKLWEIKPELIICIDHPRKKHITPPEIPYICWLQDEMDWIYGASPEEFGRNDYIFTNLAPVFKKLGWPAEKYQEIPIPGNGDIFHERRGVSYNCDVAYVSNLPRWKPSDVKNSPVERVMYRIIRRRMEEDGLDSCVSDEDYLGIMREAFDAQGLPIEISTGQQLAFARETRINGMGSYLNRVLPMIWLAKAGFDLKLYGNGWEDTPLKKYARGPVEHGEALSRVYQGAKINISISTGVTMHPRVLECLLSGGFMLARHTPREKDMCSIYDFFETCAQREEHLITFKTKEDLIEKVSFYLKSEYERKPIITRGRNRSLARYTFKITAEKMIGAVLKNNEPEQ